MYGHFRSTCEVSIQFLASQIIYTSINPFIPNASFLYPLKTSENRNVFWCFLVFSGGREKMLGNKWINGSKNTHKYGIERNFLEIKVEKSILKVIYKNFIKQEIQEEEI